jgi:hypothetical protein
MSGQTERFIRKAPPPDATETAAFLGAEAHALWQALTERIASAYPGVFAPDWSNGGQKNGWGLRYRKSKSFCTLIPERGHMAVMIVFGGKEREKVADILPDLDARFQKAYAEAHTYHDGKWVLFTVRSDGDVGEIMTILQTKRRPSQPAS